VASSGEIVDPTPSRVLSVLQIVFFREADLDPLKHQGSCDHPNGMMIVKGPRAIRGHSWPATTRSRGPSIVVVNDHGACEEVLQGAANAFTSPLLLAALAESTTEERLGRSMGTFAAVQTAGVVSAPLIGGLAGAIDIRLAFLVPAAVALLLAFSFQTTSLPMVVPDTVSLVPPQPSASLKPAKIFLKLGAFPKQRPLLPRRSKKTPNQAPLWSSTAALSSIRGATKKR